MTKEEIERAHETVTKEWARSEMNQRVQGLLDHLESRIERRVAQELAKRAVLVGTSNAGLEWWQALGLAMVALGCVYYLLWGRSASGVE